MRRVGDRPFRYAETGWISLAIDSTLQLFVYRVYSRGQILYGSFKRKLPIWARRAGIASGERPGRDLPHRRSGLDPLRGEGLV